jgi:transmembrane sensor
VRSGRWGVGLAASVGAAALIIAALVWTGDTRTYTTDIGENRILHLEDGSIMQLNAASRAEVTFDTRVRAIRLARGEAMFKVARDPARPFRVYAGANVIQALGTAFDVLNRPTGTTVSVLEGVVQITSPRRPEGAVASDVLQAGEETRIDTVGRIEQRSSVDTARMAAWRNSRLDFRADRLDDIAAQFNRYNDTPRIVIQDDAAAARRFSGVFDADDPHSLVDFLREEGGLVVEDQGRKIVVSTRNQGPPR